MSPFSSTSIALAGILVGLETLFLVILAAFFVVAGPPVDVDDTGARWAYYLVVVTAIAVVFVWAAAFQAIFSFSPVPRPWNLLQLSSFILTLTGHAFVLVVVARVVAATGETSALALAIWLVPFGVLYTAAFVVFKHMFAAKRPLRSASGAID